MRKPYSIYLPDWETCSGGIRVLYGLYGGLLTKGQVVIPNMTTTESDYITIYPEIVRGTPLSNPAARQTVVRYLLNKPGTMALYGTPGPTTFDKTDLIYSFSKMYYDTDDKHTLFLPILDLHTFKDQKKNRNKKCVFIGKGEDKHLHPEGCIAIDRKFAEDQQALADLLNECEIMYSYDPISAMTEIARLCGCRVVLLQNIYSKSEYRDYEPGLNGMSFGLDEEVKLDTEGFRSHYGLLKKTFSVKLDMFIEDTQNA